MMAFDAIQSALLDIKHSRGVSIGTYYFENKLVKKYSSCWWLFIIGPTVWLRIDMGMDKLWDAGIQNLLKSIPTM